MNDIPFDDITYLSLNAFRKPIANVRWYLNRYCNYDCSYCWPLSHQKEKDFLKKEEYLITIHEIIKQLTDNGLHKKVEKCIQERVCDCVADLKMPKWK